MDVSVVVTVLNEAGAVDELYTRVAATLDGRDWEAIFVDDGSTDDTYAKLRALHERDARVRVVRFKRNFGQHPAMHAGLARALGDEHRDDGRRPAERAGGHPEAARRARPGRRGLGTEGRPPRLGGPHRAEPR